MSHVRYDRLLRRAASCTTQNVHLKPYSSTTSSAYLTIAQPKTRPSQLLPPPEHPTCTHECRLDRVGSNLSCPGPAWRARSPRSPTMGLWCMWYVLVNRGQGRDLKKRMGMYFVLFTQVEGLHFTTHTHARGLRLIPRPSHTPAYSLTSCRQQVGPSLPLGPARP